MKCLCVYHLADLDQQAGINQREQASVKHDASQAGTSVGGVSISGSGVAANDERRAQGQADQTTAHLKQAVGGIFSDDLKRQGEREQADAEATQASGQASDLTTGVLDRAAGAVKQAVAADGTTAHAAAKAQHDQGKTLQRGVEAEVKKT